MADYKWYIRALLCTGYYNFTIFIISVIIISIVGFCPDIFLCKINISVIRVSLLKGDNENNEHFTLLNNIQYTVLPSWTQEIMYICVLYVRLLKCRYNINSI